MKYDVCIITEKSSQAKNYSTALGGPSGTLKSGPLAGKTYIITNAVGHLYNLADSSTQVEKELQWRYGMPWTLENNALPWSKNDLKWKLKKSEGKSKAIEDIVKYAKDASYIVLGTDFDKSYEGDLLACEIIIENGLNKKKHFYRSLHRDESAKEINKAMDNLVDYGTDLTKRPEYISSDFRRKYDYLLGLQETRLATKLAGDNLLRWGRLKSYILKICYDQQKLIDEYVEIPYYEAKFKDENEVIYSNPDETKYNDESKVPIGDFHSSEVVKDSETPGTKIPPLFKNLAQIASALASKYSGKQIETTYQKLYEDSILSYPRTDSHYITEEEWNAYNSIADDVAIAIGVDPTILTRRSPRATHIKEGLAHGANHILKAVPLADIESRYDKCARDIYEYVAKNTLTIFCEDYEYITEKGHLKDYPKFKGSKQRPTKLGWKEIFNDDDIIDTAVGLGRTGKPFVFRGTNPKPELLTLKWIIKQLNKDPENNVGTGATQLSTINQLCETQDASHPLENSKGKITLTNFGILSGLLLKDTKIADLDFTKNFYIIRENVFNDPSTADKYLDSIEEIIRFDLNKVQENLKSINLVELTGGPDGQIIGKCPICGSDVKAITTKFGKKVFPCNNSDKDKNPTPCKFVLYGSQKYFNDTIPLTIKKVQDLLDGKMIQASLKAQSGKKYLWDMKLEINDAGYPQLVKVDFANKK